MVDDPTVRAHPLRAEAEADLTRLMHEITMITGLGTRWGGVVQVRDLEFGHAGQKHGWCGISLREDVLAVPEQRWTTMIHEALHSVSGAFPITRLDPTSGRWEEAIVEQTQRLLRSELLRRLRVILSEESLRALDDSHRYNGHIRALELLRESERRNGWDFYLQLLASTTEQRAWHVVAASRLLAMQRGTGQ